MLALLHGYGLSGAGSNLWTREVARALCRNGTSFHLFCQESRPERYDWIAEAVRYDDQGRPETLFERDTPYPGRCVLHRPDLKVLPAYVRPQQPSKYVFAILDLDDEAIEDYLARNERVLEHLVRHHGVTGLHVNHVVLLSEAARRVKGRTGVRYAVMPHGSAIEYVVRPSPKYHAVAARALFESDHVFTLNDEIRGRLADVFPDLDLADRMVDVPVGVDTSAFRMVPREARGEAVARIASVLRDRPRGKSPARRSAFLEAVRPGLTADAFAGAMREGADYDRGAADEDAEARLAAVDWAAAETMLYVGRLTRAKGVHSVVAAFPAVLARRPSALLIVAGAGPLREPLEAYLHALASGHPDLARDILRWADPDGGDLTEAAAYLDRLRSDGRLDEYTAAAARLPERVIFTGFMDHDGLSHVYALGDVGVFPSVVKEASPMVIPEAAAAGCVPLGTDFAGTADSLRRVGGGLPEDVQPLMRVSPDPERTVADIAHHVTALLERGDLPREALRKVAVDRYDWHEIAGTLSETLAP